MSRNISQPNYQFINNLNDMTNKRFNESQIYRILQEYEEGVSINDLIGRYKISLATFYNWKKKYKGLKIHEISHLNKLEEENDRLKRLFAEISLENLTLKRMLESIDPSYITKQGNFNF